MNKVVLVKIGDFQKLGIENGQRTLRFFKKSYDFEKWDEIVFYYQMDGMNVLVEGEYEVTEIYNEMQSPYALVSFKKIRDYEDE